MNNLKAIFAICTLALTAAASAQTVKVSAKIDSVEVRQGMLRQIDVEVVQPAGMALQWSVPELKADSIFELYPGIEVAHTSKIDTSKVGDRLQLVRTLLIQPWDSGEFVIKDLYLTNGSDTFASNPLALKVIPADIDTMTSIHSEYMPTVNAPRHFWDWLPDVIYNYWWAWLIGLIVIVGGTIAWIIYRRGGSRAVKRKAAVMVPPYERAKQRLHALQQQHLCEKGEEKQYYTTLTDILREYLEGRFGINAMEMTTPQIKRAVYATVSEKSASAMMNDILEMADYVKFAKLRPLPEDNMRAFRQAAEFVENTRPDEPQGKEDSK